MKKLLLLLCSIGANAAFATDTCNVRCAVEKNGQFEIVEPTIKEKSKVVSGEITNTIYSKHMYSMGSAYATHFMDTDANYDKYLDACIKSSGSSQKVRGILCLNSKDEEVMWHNPMHNTLQDTLKDNPKLAAFAEVKAFGTLVAAKSGPLTITSRDGTFIKFHTPGSTSSLNGTTIANPIDSFKTLILENNRKLRIPSDSAEAVGLFLSRYLHDNNGLLDNLPFSYGLTKARTNTVSQVDVSVTSYDKATKTVSIKIDLTLEPNKLINGKYHPNVTAEMSIPLVLHTKDYKPGDKKQKLTIDVPKAGPLVALKEKQSRHHEVPVDAKTNAEFLALVANNITDLYIYVDPQNPNAIPNSDKFTPADIKPM